MHTIQEIEARLSAIAAELESASAEQITALNEEVDSLIAEREALRAAEEQRASLRNRVASGNVGSTPAPVVPEQKRTYTADSETPRNTAEHGSKTWRLSERRMALSTDCSAI